MYRIAICEDDINYINYLKKVVLETSLITEEESIFCKFVSGEEFLAADRYEFDVVFMDIQLGGIDGYETIKKLREMDGKTLVVFCSGTHTPDSESFKFTPFRYLLKEYSDEKMISEMKEIIEEMKYRKAQPSLICKNDDKRIKVYADSILYVENRKRGSQVYLYGKTRENLQKDIMVAEKSLSEVSEILSERRGFWLIHSSYVVNMDYIVEIMRDNVKLVDGTELNIARSKKNEFKNAFAQYMASKYKGENY